MRLRHRSKQSDVAGAGERSDRDRGVSLIEIVVAIALMGTIVVAILDAVRTSVVASSVSREAAQVETVLINAADRVNRADFNGDNCDEEQDYEEYVVAAVRSHGWWRGEGEYGMGVEVTTSHYDQTPDGTGEWVPVVCPNPEEMRMGAQLVQKVEITITSPDRKVSRTIEVIKSDV